MLGSGGCIVMDDTTDMVWSTVRLLKFGTGKLVRGARSA